MKSLPEPDHLRFSYQVLLAAGDRSLLSLYPYTTVRHRRRGRRLVPELQDPSPFAHHLFPLVPLPLQ